MVSQDVVRVKSVENVKNVASVKNLLVLKLVLKQFLQSAFRRLFLIFFCFSAFIG